MTAKRAAIGLALFLVGVQGPVAAGGTAAVDPTRPPGGSAAASAAAKGEKEAEPAEALKLESLLVGTGRRVAIISGQSVRIGERIHGYTVQNILRREVVLADGGKTRVLRLTPRGGLE
ncbi:MAG TPA: hypothetical protein VJ985_07640, partial [Gammaproteobacteria bacterium]|nr:hypothetical protein [Gammaproteobacteria bacterium]